ncbi:tRNA lysidine(34) synthetase TilS [Oceanobacillus halophilus]|uniref:tRNA(Ile)-lysidine synthase n=1 Tax=Oceanobacillus halophilus TaxID=930130 RepID=A0A495A0W6_9BACI|nr:tRNA lysidine(34) synthetase TilS [Oceanobacillus halophilus]
MNQPVLKFIKKHQLLTNGATVLVGVSGGADSMALLHFFHSIREKWNLKVIAISIDHQLRGEESRSDIEYVEKVCKNWDIPFVWESVNVANYMKKKHLSTEVAARDLRYQCFAKQMNVVKADFLALGHHGDDQIETMLMSLTRSATSNAFSGIPVKREFESGWIIRPFLCITKASILDYCKDTEIEPRIDQTNFDTSYTRNFFRKHILPLIKEKNNNIHTTIQHLTETLHEDEKFLQVKAKEMVNELVVFDKKNNTAVIEIDLFKNYAQALQRRALHLILNYLYKQIPKGLSYMHEEQFFSLLNDKGGNSHLDFPSQLKVEKSYGKIQFHFKGSILSEDLSYHYLLHIPGKVTLFNGSVITAEYPKESCDQDPLSHDFLLDEKQLPLHIRTRKPGDRMSWKGLNGSRKLKDIFIDEKIPIDERNSWPIIVDNNGEILWLIGLKKGKTKAYQEKGIRVRIKYVIGNK